MTENFGNEIWKEILSEKRLNDVLTWHRSVRYDMEKRPMITYFVK